MKHKERDDYVTYVADSWEEVYEIVERIYKFEQWWILNKNLEKLKLYKQAQKEYIRERKKRS